VILLLIAVSDGVASGEGGYGAAKSNVKLSGRTVSLSARGDTTEHHGPLQRLLEVAHGECERASSFSMCLGTSLPRAVLHNPIPPNVFGSLEYTRNSSPV
jgi:hypothetical protein